VTSAEWSFLASVGFLMLLVAGIMVPLAFRTRRQLDAEARNQPPPPPISIERTPQTIVITINLQPATDPPHPS
jgi:hypothetical protein